MFEFERVEYVNIDVTGRLKDWIKYQVTPIWKDLIRCARPATNTKTSSYIRPNCENCEKAGITATQVGAKRQSNSTGQRQEQSAPHGKEE